MTHRLARLLAMMPKAFIACAARGRRAGVTTPSRPRPFVLSRADDRIPRVLPARQRRGRGRKRMNVRPGLQMLARSPAFPSLLSVRRQFRDDALDVSLSKHGHAGQPAPVRARGNESPHMGEGGIPRVSICDRSLAAGTAAAAPPLSVPSAGSCLRWPACCGRT